MTDERSKPPFWKKPKPKGRKTRHLSEAQQQAARKRAKAGKRRYPNLVDNAWASRLPREP